MAISHSSSFFFPLATATISCSFSCNFKFGVLSGSLFEMYVGSVTLFILSSLLLGLCLPFCPHTVGGKQKQRRSKQINFCMYWPYDLLFLNLYMHDLRLYHSFYVTFFSLSICFQVCFVMANVRVSSFLRLKNLSISLSYSLFLPTPSVYTFSLLFSSLCNPFFFPRQWTLDFFSVLHNVSSQRLTMGNCIKSI